MSPKRIQRKRIRGACMPEGARYVGHPSRWSNPFFIYQDRHLVGPTWSVARNTWGRMPADQEIVGYVTSSHPIHVAKAVALFQTLIDVRLRDEPERLRQWLAPLRGHDLACWCSLDQPCHGDVLLAAANSEVAA